jgi:hypothetical protein
MRAFGFGLVAWLTLTMAASACDMCGCGIAQGQCGMACMPEKPAGAFVGVTEQFTHFGTLQEDGEHVSNPAGQYEDSSISQGVVGWQFNERFSVQFALPVIYRAFKRPEGFAIDRGTVSGIGDVSLIASARVWQHQWTDAEISWTVSAGVKFPTGDSGRLREEINETPPPPGAPESAIHGHDLALGSGSYDGIVGSGVYAARKRFFATAQIQYAIRSEGSYGYRYANDLVWNGGPGFYVVQTPRCTCGVQLNVAGETKPKDTFRGSKAEDTGVTTVYLGPGVTLVYDKKLHADLDVDIPVSVDNTALQAVPDYRVRASVTYRF